MRVQPLAEGDGQHLALVGQHDPALRQVEVQRLPLVAGALSCGPGGPERPDDALGQRLGHVIGKPVGRCLRLAVGQRGLRAHQSAGEAVAALMSLGVEHQPDGDAGAVGAVDERAEVAGEPVREHRHHPVGEVGRVAAPPRLAVERAARSHVGGDVGDGDPDDVAAGVRRIVVRMREHSVVVVTGVGRVDRHQRQRPEVLAAAERQRSRCLGLRERRLGELVGDAVLVDGDQRDRPRRGGVAEPRDNARARQSVTPRGAELLGLDELAFSGAGAVGGGDEPVAVGALVDGGDATATLCLVEDADDALRPHADAADHPGSERGIRRVESGHPPEQAVARAEGGVVAAGEYLDARRRPLAVPVGRLGPEVALGVGAGDPQHQNGRQLALRPHPALALLQEAVAAHAGEELLQLDLGGPLETEGAGDLALAGLRGVLAQEGEDLVGGREAVHGAHLARVRCGR